MYLSWRLSMCLSFLFFTWSGIGFADPQTTPSTQVKPAQVESSTQQKEDHRIDLNAASVSELKTLKGIGKKLAQRIIDDRKANGPFMSVDEFTRVKGIGKKTLAKNRDRIRVSTPRPKVKQ